METARVAATVAIPILFYWLGRGTMRGRWRVVLWIVAVCVALIAVGAPLYIDRKREAETQARAIVLAELAGKTARAEALAKEIPEGCPEGIDADYWNAKVEAWREETSRILAPYSLAPAFADDKDHYPHACKIEWVRSRLDYFADRLEIVIFVLGKP